MSVVTFSTPTGGLTYLENKGDLQLSRGSIITSAKLVEATGEFDKAIDTMFDSNIDIADILGMRNLSSFVGELFASRLLQVTKPMFRKNPHQDGYPDLLLMDDEGTRLWDDLTGRQQEKKPFSPFPGGGLEVKATCGDVPSPQELAKKGKLKPLIGDSRIELLRGFNWKAHHQETNNLLGVLWDFVDSKPKIIGVFFSSILTTEDWGKIVQPKKGGGKTTSVSIMNRAGVDKMCEGWVIMLDSKAHMQFIERYSKRLRDRKTFSRSAI